MDYDVAASKERLTGRAYFNPAYSVVGGVPTNSQTWLDLGNIEMMSLDYGIKRKEHFKARRGILIADRFDAYSATPRWEITGDEFTSSTLALIFLGTDAGTITQSAGTTTQSFQVAIGGVLDTGKFALHTWSIGGTATVEGRDWIVDAGPGKLYIPRTTILTNGEARGFTYSWPLIKFDRILPPLTNLNRNGLMQLFEEDDSSPVSPSTAPSPKTVHDFAVSLSTDEGGQTKVDDYKSFKMVATITDPATWSIKKRYT